MSQVRFVALAFATLAALALPSRADAELYSKPVADTWPLAVIERPLTLAPGMLEVRGDTLRASLSEGAVAEPISLAPDIYVGLDRKFTVGLTHQIGVCLTPGEESNCPTPYQDVGAEVLYSFMEGGNFQLAFRGGIEMPRFDPFHTGLRAGAILRGHGGKVAVRAEPSLYVGLAGRSNETPNLTVPAKDVLDVPVTIQIQAQEQSAIFLSSGFRERLSGFGDSYEIPLGAGATFSLTHRLDLGAEFRMDDLFGTEGGIERRLLFLRAALRV